MTAAAVHPGRNSAWLEEILRLLPLPRAAVRVPDPPEELQPLVEMSRDTLGARDLGDLHARLDGHVMRLRELRVPASPRQVEAIGEFPELPEQAEEDSLIVRSLGLNVSGKFLRAMREAALLFRLGSEILSDADMSRRTRALFALGVRPWSLHDGHVVPHALVESAIVQARGLVAFGALLATCFDARKPEPWLTSALADEVLYAVREVMRLIASAGYDVGPSKPDRLLDLPALWREAHEADAAFRAAFEADVRAGHIGMPEDE